MRQEGVPAPIIKTIPCQQAPHIFFKSPKLTKESTATPPPCVPAILPCPCYFAVWQWSVYVNPIIEYGADHMQIYVGSLFKCLFFNMSVWNSVHCWSGILLQREDIILKGMCMHLNYHQKHKIFYHLKHRLILDIKLNLRGALQNLMLSSIVKITYLWALKYIFKERVHIKITKLYFKL